MKIRHKSRIVSASLACTASIPSINKQDEVGLEIQYLLSIIKPWIQSTVPPETDHEGTHT